jgi:cytochrome c biogenesis protein CcdA
LAVDPVLLSFAFAAGAVAFVNPCGAALIPAYISLYLGTPSGGAGRRVLKAAALGLAATLGFIAVFMAAGLLFAVAGAALLRYAPWMAAAVGLLVLLMGLALLAGWHPNFQLGVDAARLMGGSGVAVYPLFGAAYAVASLTCTLPIFVYVALQAFAAGGLLQGVAVLLAYSAGMGAAMTAFSVALAAARGFVERLLPRVAPYALRVAGLIMALAGAYVIYLQLVVGMGVR